MFFISGENSGDPQQNAICAEGIEDLATLLRMKIVCTSALLGQYVVLSREKAGQPVWMFVGSVEIFTV